MHRFSVAKAVSKGSFKQWRVGVYLNRAVGGHRDYRHPGGYAVARAQQGKLKGQEAVCRSNLKQMGLGEIMYFE